MKVFVHKVFYNKDTQNLKYKTHRYWNNIQDSETLERNLTEGHQMYVKSAGTIIVRNITTPNKIIFKVMQSMNRQEFRPPRVQEKFRVQVHNSRK